MREPKDIAVIIAIGLPVPAIVPPPVAVPISAIAVVEPAVAPKVLGGPEVLRTAKILRTTKIAAKARLLLESGTALAKIWPKIPAIIAAVSAKIARVIPAVGAEIAALIAKLWRGGYTVAEITPVLPEAALVITAFPAEITAIVAAFRAEITHRIALLKRGLELLLRPRLRLELRLGPRHDNLWHVGARSGKGGVGPQERARLLRRRGIGLTELTRAGLAGLKTRAAAIGRTLLAKLWLAAETAIVLGECRTRNQSDCTQQRDDQRLNHHVLQSSVDPRGRWRRCPVFALAAMSVV